MVKTMGRCSLKAMERLWGRFCMSDQCPWNHWPWKKPPKQMLPEASVKRPNWPASVELSSRNREMPFQCDRRCDHILRSSLASWISMNRWKRCWTEKAASKRQHMNGLPGATTRAANLEWPRRADDQFWHRIWPRARKRSFPWDGVMCPPGGGTAFFVSNVMLGYLRQGEGPEVLGFKGHQWPRSLQGDEGYWSDYSCDELSSK